jgi:sulfate adenylyltransferase subunit 1 (EFTu-like GTPase family)
MLGLEQVIAVLNKMDLVDYGRERFEEVKGNLLSFLSSIGIKPSFIIPISAKKGDFVAERTDNLPWYDGPTVLEALDTFKRRPAPTDKPLRLPIQDVYKFDGERVAVGRVESGVIRRGDRIMVLPGKRETTVVRLVEFGKNPTEAVAGKSIGLIISDKLFLDRGDVIVHPGNLPIITDTIEGHLFWLDDEPYRRGERITFKCATQEVMCDIEINEVIDSSTLEKVDEDGEKIENRQVANVLIKTAKPVVVENFNEIRELGRFVLERKDTCAGGIITSLR